MFCRPPKNSGPGAFPSATPRSCRKSSAGRHCVNVRLLSHGVPSPQRHFTAPGANEVKERRRFGAAALVFRSNFPHQRVLTHECEIRLFQRRLAVPDMCRFCARAIALKDGEALPGLQIPQRGKPYVKSAKAKPWNILGDRIEGPCHLSRGMPVAVAEDCTPAVATNKCDAIGLA